MAFGLEDDLYNKISDLNYLLWKLVSEAKEQYRYDTGSVLFEADKYLDEIREWTVVHCCNLTTLWFVELLAKEQGLEKLDPQLWLESRKKKLEWVK